jgi:hypothetical protein
MYRRSKGGWGWGGVAVLVPHPCAQVRRMDGPPGIWCRGYREDFGVRASVRAK